MGVSKTVTFTGCISLVKSITSGRFFYDKHFFVSGNYGNSFNLSTKGQF